MRLQWNTGQTVRRYRRYRVERFLATVSRSLAGEDPASEHYFWRIAQRRETLFHQTRDELAADVGHDAADHLIHLTARRALRSRRGLLAAPALLWAAPLPFRGLTGMAAVLLGALGAFVGSGLLRRNLRRAAHILGNPGGQPLGRFPAGDVRRAVRRHRRRVPASALRPRPLQAVLAAHLDEYDPEILETAGRLSEEFDGSAAELLETARRLA